MKKILLIKNITLVFTFCLLNQTLKAQDEFISIWQSTEEYPSIEIPTYDTQVYNYTVNWGDGSVSNNVAGDITHQYAATGNYTVTITGVFPGIHFGKIYDHDNPYNEAGIVSIEQWGINQWEVLHEAFYGQKNLVINATDIPDLSLCTSLSRMFSICRNINNGSHNRWNEWETSTITNMYDLFSNSNFNQNIGNWDVSNVNLMIGMFRNSSFNQDIGNWDVSNVIHMSSMFLNASSFNQNISNWDVSSATDMHHMFSFSMFNQNIDNWDVSNVTNMRFMFSNTPFNENISNWNVSNVMNMGYMFNNSSFNQNLNNWNVSNVIFMSNMFSSSLFNGNISNWNVNRVTDMSSMFAQSNFNQNINNWNVSRVRDMSSMFSGATSFNQPLNNWNVSNVTDMSNMFSNSSFNQNINNWNVINVTNMSGMFKYVNTFNQPLNNWDVSSVTNMSEMFLEANSFNQLLNNWDVSNVTDMSFLFKKAGAFNQPINNWNITNVTNMVSMFESATLFNQSLNDWDVANVSNMSNMFEDAISFNLPLKNWNTSNVSFMVGMFKNALTFNQNIGSWSLKNIESCVEMFYGVTLSNVNYEALLIGWNDQDLNPNIVFDGGNSNYYTNEVVVAKQNMLNNDNWTITDDGKTEQIIWTGANSTDWNDPGNWDTNTVPTQNENVILANVANAPIINTDENHIVNKLINNQTLSISTNSSLTVLDDINQRNTISISSSRFSNGSLVVRGNQLNLTPPNITYLRYVSGNNWHTIASPVTNFDIDVFAAATALAEGQNNNRGIGFYDNNANPRWSYYQDGANDTGNFIAGKGYSIRTSANAFLNFTGKLNANNVSNYAITENLDGWNLVGNPYPAFINANTNADENENLLTQNAVNLDPVFANIYVWNPTTTSYEPIGNGLGARYIAPGQGFFVKARNGGGTIDIQKSMLSHQTGNLFLKGNQPQKIVLQIDDKTNISETTIAFKQGMTKGLDVTYDAAVFSGESKSLSIYTNLLEDNENTPFAIQFLPALENNDFIIPLGIKQNEASEITLSLKKTSLTSNKKIYLEDKLENTFTEISNNSDYKFSHQNDASETGRFYVHFQQKALHINTIDASKISIYKDNNNAIQVKGISNGVLNMYSITGQQILKNRRVNSNSATIQIPKISRGVYLLKINFEGKEYVQKMLF